MLPLDGEKGTWLYDKFAVTPRLILTADRQVIDPGKANFVTEPVFGGRGGATVPELFTLGGWLAGGRDWHFGVMGLYGANLGVWIALLLRQRHQRLAALGDLGTLRVSSNTPKRRLAAHRLVYTLMLIVLGFSLITGMAMYNPAQLWWLVGLFSFAEAAGHDSWQVLRVCHLATIPAIALLLAAHLVLSWRVGGLRLWRSMAF